MSSIALTDNGNLFGAMEFTQKALIKKIIAAAPKTKKIKALIILYYFLWLQGATDFLNLQFYDVQ